MSGGKVAEAWRSLNARQQLYLSAIYDADHAERDIRERSARWEKTPPADEWRMLLYDLKLPKDIVGYSTIQAALRRKNGHDSGAGSTLAVLERRGLVLVEHDEVFVALVGMVPRIRVRLTTAGRAAVRAGQGVTAPFSAGLPSRQGFDRGQRDRLATARRKFSSRTCSDRPGHVGERSVRPSASHEGAFGRPRI